MTTLQRQQHNRIAHLSGEDLETLGRELDAIRQQVLDSRGERDADYIRNVIDFQRKLELGSRAVLLSSLFPPAWLAGTVGLSVAKIVENMEIGHNVDARPVGLDARRQDPFDDLGVGQCLTLRYVEARTMCGHFPEGVQTYEKKSIAGETRGVDPRTEGRRFRLGQRSVRPEVRPSMRSRVDARVPAGQVQRR